MISVENLTKQYGATTVVDGVSMVIERNSITAIVGTSGSGKSTLLRMINRLVEPTRGRVLIDGNDTTGEPAHLLRRRIGYVIQGHGLFPHRTVAENIAITPRLLGWARQRQAARVDALIDLVRLERGQRERYPHQLSGGERQRVGVARAIAAEPRIVLMDEPFGALDPLTRDALGDDYRALHTKLGLTTVMITHDMTEAILLADRVAVMRGGRLLAQGTPNELSASRDPYVGELLRTPRRQAERLGALLPQGGVA